MVFFLFPVECGSHDRGKQFGAIRERVGDSVQTCVFAAAARAVHIDSVCQSACFLRATRPDTHVTAATWGGRSSVHCDSRDMDNRFPPADSETRIIWLTVNTGEAWNHTQRSMRGLLFQLQPKYVHRGLSLPQPTSLFVPLQTCCPSTAIIENKLLIILIWRVFVYRWSASNPDWSHLTDFFHSVITACMWSSAQEFEGYRDALFRTNVVFVRMLGETCLKSIYGPIFDHPYSWKYTLDIVEFRRWCQMGKVFITMIIMWLSMLKLSLCATFVFHYLKTSNNNKKLNL